MKPLIGITANYSTSDKFGTDEKIGAKNQEWELIAEDYIYAIEQAGGIPIILPNLNSIENIEAIAQKLDGILFSGGNDLDPSYFGEEAVEELGKIVVRRDSFEMALLEYTLKRTRLPVLGICRGCQLLNVALGGSLYQDLKYQFEEFKNNSTNSESQTWVQLDHVNKDAPKHKPTHTAEVTKESRLYGVFKKDEIPVNSFHHQTISRVGEGLQVTMRAEDNTVEAIEFKSNRYVVGIQWHPEMMVRDHPMCADLFVDFVNKCKEQV